MNNRLSLFELTSYVHDVIESTMPAQYWVEAELMEIRESRGHCYMELVQKDVFSSSLVARASAKCWASQWQRVLAKFVKATGGVPRAGMKLLVKAKVEFHTAYGFSLIVSDIDPTYTLGDIAQRRQEIIMQLKDEGVYDLQRELALPVFCQRIAVISSATAAGYGDFSNQLATNEYGLQFYPTLFQASMQGDMVEQTIINSLDEIHSQIDDFDCVVIIRGGGAVADMSAFDSLLLAENVANFPIPIITGIGHDRDECVLDLISHRKVKTPTAAAAFLISHLADVLYRIEEAQSTIFSIASNAVEQHKQRLSLLKQSITSSARLYCSHRQSEINRLEIQLEMTAKQQLSEQKHYLQLLSQRISSLDPKLLLRRGYTITLREGKIIKNASQLKSGDEIETMFGKGSVKSVVTN